MRETPLSNCEREFILQAVAEKKRIDGRDCYEYRPIKISFGIERGNCLVELGDTRVMCQVSCDVITPKQARPSEGMLFVNLELSPMAAAQFEVGRQSDYGVEITRILERCIKESRCVDTESLCIMAGIKVWSIRADIHVLNHEGGLIDAASVAAIAALTHFRRPDVTVVGEDVTIHSMEDRDPVPLSVHHMPICITFAFFEQGKYLLVDPNEKEERVMEGKMVIGMNKHRELCTLQMAGSMMLLKDQVLRCSNIAVLKVTEITALIHRAIENDASARASGGKFGFAASVDTTKVTVHEAGPDRLMMSEDSISNSDYDFDDEDDITPAEVTELRNRDFESKIITAGPGTVVIGEGGKSTWAEEDDDGEMEINEELDNLKMKEKEKRLSGGGSDPVAVSDDSEEDCTVILDSDDLHMGSMKTGGKSPVEIDLTSALKKPGGHKKKMKNRPR